MSSLRSKFITYLNMIPSIQDKHGFIESQECDSLLFTGLVGCVNGLHIDLDKAYDSQKDQWNRRPIDNPCYPDGSKSSISRDMLLGLCWYAYFNKRKDILEGVINHALKNWGMMGEAEDLATKFGRCFIGPGLLATYAWALYKLGGRDFWWLRWIPADYGHGLTDFQAHLQVLHILLRTILSEKQSKSDSIKLKDHYKRQPNNPLFAIACGDIYRARVLLLDSNLWPEDRLPNSDDRKTQWIPQRDEGPDWQPSDEDTKTHSGGDLLFCYWLMTQKKFFN